MMEVNLTNRFLEYAAAVRGEIDAALDRLTQYDDDCPAQLRAAIRHSLLAPGKRLRPLLVLMAAEACGCPRERALPAACAVEMIHTYSLIHDDLPAMDDDDCAAASPVATCQFGEATAILAGDALLAQAFEVAGGRGRTAGNRGPLLSGTRPRRRGRRHWSADRPTTWTARLAQGSLERLERIHRRKTGAMFWCPCGWAG